MSLIKRFVNATINTLGKLRIKINEVLSPIIEAGRTNSYVETYSNKADTVHRHIKENSERDLKRAFEFNARKAIGRMGLGKVVLAIDGTEELYFGKNGKLNVRQIKHERGTEEAFAYVVVEIIKPRSVPLMAIPYKQGDDITAIVKELLNYALSLRIIIEAALFDRGFYIGELIQFLEEKHIKYLIFVPENNAMKNYIALTDKFAWFNHKVKWNKHKSNWEIDTKIVIIWDEIIRKGKRIEYYWIFATNLKHSRNLIKVYKQRWQIETDFRVHDEARIMSKSSIPLVRYFYFLMSLILMANWEVNRIEHPYVTFKRYLKNVEEKVKLEIT
jgi:hypothetical protein